MPGGQDLIIREMRLLLLGRYSVSLRAWLLGKVQSYIGP